MKTVGYFDDSRGPGGTTRYLLDLLHGLDRTRYTPVFFARAHRPWHDSLRELQVEVIAGAEDAGSPEATDGTEMQLPLRRAPVRSPGALNALKATVAWHRWLHRETAELTALFQRRPVDLLHSNNAGDEPAPIAARRAGVPRVVATLHIDPSYDLLGTRRARHFRRLQRRSLAALDTAIAVSRRTGEEWKRHLDLHDHEPPKFVVVPNGVHLERLARRRSRDDAKLALGLPTTAFVIGSLGRLDPAKGYADLVAALPSVIAACPEAVFVHAGRGPLAAPLAEQANRLDVTASVYWLGFRSDVRDLLEACDVYVQPSWCEAQGLAVLEAGALGLPAIASAIGGLPESLDAGNAGWLVPARDSAALAETLIRVLQCPEEMHRRGQRLANRVRTLYQSDQMVQRTMAVYDSL